jgi:hypothetical protein
MSHGGFAESGIFVPHSQAQYDFTLLGEMFAPQGSTLCVPY